MNDLFNILIFSKDYNQGAIIQDYIKATGYNSQVFDQEKAAYEGLLSGNFTFCIIDHDIDTKISYQSFSCANIRREKK